MANSFEYAEKHAQKIIIIHPGSLYLKIGRASDLNPQSVLHAIARRRKPGGQIHHDQLREKSNITKELYKRYDDIFLKMQSDFSENCTRKSVSTHLKIPEELHNIPATKEEMQDDTICGDDILSLSAPQQSQYNLHFPIKGGEFNLHSGPGGTITSICQDLETIWSHVLSLKMKIDLSRLTHYKAVLVVPDIHAPTYLKLLTNIVLKNMKFGACLVMQENVAATFGAGLGYACVVDIGDKKISVSCVEDGVSHAKSRLKLNYGGSDITKVYSILLNKSKKYPIMENTPRAAITLKICKEKYSRIEDDCEIDELTIPPLSLFYTELFMLNQNRNENVPPYALHMFSSSTDPEDYIDADFVRDTGRKKEHMDQFVIDGANMTVSENIIVDDMDVVDVLEIDSNEFLTQPKDTDNILSLDEAILQSIDRCSNDEMKRKMYGCILVVGGGGKFNGFGQYLKRRLYMQIPNHYRTDYLDVLIGIKDMDPCTTSWKGSAIMSCLDSASELWVSKAEWEKLGLRILREKSCFMW